eukprot:TRINITY_DN1717_c0_g1_i1.p1 TRINITY_DN1717_c0_g1~~TRINITY_DN1717_c0_g1_i1.p1  ORF type:complete len:1162 (+),score=220.81 TRINITY_DN1717_c0_g1_i1:163-3648(+)
MCIRDRPSSTLPHIVPCQLYTNTASSTMSTSSIPRSLGDGGGRSPTKAASGTEFSLARTIGSIPISTLRGMVQGIATLATSASSGGHDLLKTAHMATPSPLGIEVTTTLRPNAASSNITLSQIPTAVLSSVRYTGTTSSSSKQQQQRGGGGVAQTQQQFDAARSVSTGGGGFITCTPSAIPSCISQTSVSTSTSAASGTILHPLKTASQQDSSIIPIAMSFLVAEGVISVRDLQQFESSHFGGGGSADGGGGPTHQAAFWSMMLTRALHGNTPIPSPNASNHNNNNNTSSSTSNANMEASQSVSTRSRSNSGMVRYRKSQAERTADLQKLNSQVQNASQSVLRSSRVVAALRQTLLAHFSGAHIGSSSSTTTSSSDGGGVSTAPLGHPHFVTCNLLRQLLRRGQRHQSGGIDRSSDIDSDDDDDDNHNGSDAHEWSGYDGQNPFSVWASMVAQRRLVSMVSRLAIFAASTVYTRTNIRHHFCYTGGFISCSSLTELYNSEKSLVYYTNELDTIHASSTGARFTQAQRNAVELATAAKEIASASVKELHAIVTKIQDLSACVPLVYIRTLLTILQLYDVFNRVVENSTIADAFDSNAARSSLHMQQQQPMHLLSLMTRALEMGSTPSLLVVSQVHFSQRQHKTKSAASSLSGGGGGGDPSSSSSHHVDPSTANIKSGTYIISGRTPFHMGPNISSNNSIVATSSQHSTSSPPRSGGNNASSSAISAPFVLMGARKGKGEEDDSCPQTACSLHHCPVLTARRVNNTSGNKHTGTNNGGGSVEASSATPQQHQRDDLFDDHTTSSWLLPRRFVVHSGISVEVDSSWGLSMGQGGSGGGGYASHHNYYSQAPTQPSLMRHPSNISTSKKNANNNNKALHFLENPLSGGGDAKTPSSSTTVVGTNVLRDASKTGEAVAMHSSSDHVPLSSSIGCSAGTLVLQSVAKALMTTMVTTAPSSSSLLQTPTTTTATSTTTPDDGTGAALLHLTKVIEELFTSSAATTFNNSSAVVSSSPISKSSFSPISSSSSAFPQIASTEDPVEMNMLGNLQTLYALQYRLEKEASGKAGSLLQPRRRSAATSTSVSDDDGGDDDDDEEDTQRYNNNNSNIQLLKMPDMYMAASSFTPVDMSYVDDDDQDASRSLVADMYRRLQASTRSVLARELQRR